MLAPDGRGVLLRFMRNWSSNFYPVRLDRCANADCSSLVPGGAVLEPNDYAIEARFTSSSLRVDASGRPAVIHYDRGVAMLLRCSDAACSSFTERAIPVRDPSPAPKVWGNVLTYWFDGNDRPVIVWQYPVQAQTLFGNWFTLYSTTEIVRCANPSCSTAATSEIVSPTGASNTDAQSVGANPDRNTRSRSRSRTCRPVGAALHPRARLVSCTDATCTETASAALAFDGTSIAFWRVVPDPAGGLYFVQDDGDGLRFSRLGPL